MPAALVTSIVVIVVVGVGVAFAVRSTTPRVASLRAESEAARFWRVAGDEPVEIVGGGAIFAAISATWPFVVLQYGAAGIGVRMRGLADGSVAMKWSEVRGIERGPRSLVVRAEPARSFRFIAMGGAADLDPVVREAEARGIVVSRVGSTVGWILHG